MAPTPSMVLQFVEQVDEKHSAGHQRLRGSLNRIESDVTELRAEQQMQRETLARQDGTRERRKEISGYHVALLAAGVAILPQLIQIVIKLVSGQP